jgi:hypothetical protein
MLSLWGVLPTAATTVATVPRGMCLWVVELEHDGGIRQAKVLYLMRIPYRKLWYFAPLLLVC